MRMKEALKKISSAFRTSSRNPPAAQSSSNIQAQATLSGSHEREYRVRGMTAGARKEAGIEISGSVWHGLFVLHPAPELADVLHSHTVDIVAVHGLNGTARDTWTDKASGMLWLEDFLPDAIPQARIMTFGYDSLLLSCATGQIEDFARDLLNRLWALRNSRETINRPLVFVAHSLGGIVVKKALILANEDKRYYGDILSSTIGIIFMGTPHKGAKLADWASFLTNVTKIMPGLQGFRRNLIKDLETHSRTLDEISKSFRPRCNDLRIMSFIESQFEPPLNVLVVPKESARLDVTNEMVFPVNTHHRNICRYPSAKDQTYNLVAASIESIISGESKQHANTIHSLSVVKQYPSTSLAPNSLSVVSTASNPTLDVVSPASLVYKTPTLDYLSNEEDEGMVVASVLHEPDMSTLHISGLKPRISTTEMGWGELTLELHVPSDTEIRELPNLLRKKAPNIIIPQALKFRGRSTPIAEEWFDCFTVPVKVTKGPSCYKEYLGYKINANQSIASFLSRIFPDPMNAKIRRYPKWMQTNTGLSHSVVVGRDTLSSLQVSFMRTVRVQGGQQGFNKLFDRDQLPPQGFGTFPLLNTQPYRDQLPSEAAAQGGLLLPMYEREAMYIAFDCQGAEKFAIRPFIGGVNGISGQGLYSTDVKWTPPQKKDYIVAPEQDRLDGISIKPGVVNQFVAMKMKPKPKKGELDGDRSEFNQGPESGEVSELRKGGTVEWQMTGKDEVGGIQLQIIPQFRLDRMFAGSIRDACPREYNGILRSYQPVPDDSLVYDVLKTPEQLGLNEGDLIHVREFEARPHNEGQSIRCEMADRKEARKKKVTDLAAESPSPFGILELEVFRDPLRERVLTVRGANKAPLLFKIDVDGDFSDIQAAARDLFKMPEGELHVSGVVVHNPDILFPVKNWNDYLFATKPAISYNGFRKPKKCNHLGPGSAGGPITKNFDLVLAPSTDKWRNVCHLSFLDGADKHFGKINTPLILEISHNSTIADIRRLVQRTTRSPTDGFLFEPADSFKITDNCVIYGGPPMCDEVLVESYLPPVRSLIINHDVVSLYVETSWGKAIELRMPVTDTVDAVKILIQEREGFPPDQQKLIFRAQLLETGRTLQDYGIKGSDTLHLYLRLRGGDDGRSGGGSTIKVKLAEKIVFDGQVETVGRLKMRLFEQLGILPNRQDLGLPDDFSLEKDNLTLELQITQQKHGLLGLGVGGHIRQMIHADTSDPRMWDVSSSKILYVHIVDSRDFEDITGLPPPDTPVTWTLYKNLRLPYDRAWKQQEDSSILDVEGKGVNSDGMFDKLISLEEDDSTEPERQCETPLEDDRHSEGPVDMPKVSEYPLVLLETDQTVPWFKPMRIT
ncbi:hypothetical protein F4860DRAFT_159420 [Xylaria cubensis]|nr:hypothetical protein F4860DRAFT_159420 [Xylaria cubensis]